MNLTLERRMYRRDGIFSDLKDESGKVIAVILEHAYDAGANCWVPKVSKGVYTCTRHAPNRLPYETFELQHVPNFQNKPVTGILIHIGNYNRDSDGCLLIGQSVAFVDGIKMVTRSRDSFDRFMQSLAGKESFQLTVTG